MYVRPPNSARERVRLPENYSGNAFSNDPRADMPPPVRIPRGYDAAPQKEKHVPSDYGGEIIPQADDVPQEEFEAQIIPRDNSDGEKTDETVEASAHAKRSPSIFDSLLPPIKSLDRSFPFGHGIGSEELLILGMMMLVYLSDNEKGHFDHEFMILLGLLLFAG